MEKTQHEPKTPGQAICFCVSSWRRGNRNGTTGKGQVGVRALCLLDSQVLRA